MNDMVDTYPVNQTLLVGATTPGGIGNTFLSHAMSSHDSSMSIGSFFAPSPNNLDVTSQGSIEQWVFDNQEFCQHTNNLIYSAGVSRLSFIEDEDLDEMDKVMRVNALGLVALAGQLIAVGTPLKRIVMVVSDAAHTPMRGSVAYCASKAAAEMVVRVLARELAPGVVTVGVSPGVVEGTPMTVEVDSKVPEFRGWTPEEAKQYSDSSLVMGRRVTTKEVAQTIEFALNGPATLNGSIITINGGK